MDIGLYPIHDSEFAAVYVALTQHRRYLKEVLEEEEGSEHNGMFRENLQSLEDVIQRFEETRQELLEAKRI
ncbi:MAG: hypothetical protein ACR2NF_09860 [Pirellulales bacterium]